MKRLLNVLALQDVSLLPQTALALLNRFRWRGNAITPFSTIFNNLNPNKNPNKNEK